MVDTEMPDRAKNTLEVRLRRKFREVEYIESDGVFTMLSPSASEDDVRECLDMLERYIEAVSITELTDEEQSKEYGFITADRLIK